jgi:DNA repair protein RecN (Recombination protein N)
MCLTKNFNGAFKMLETIHIENFVLARNITIELKKGFNVFSGETGAGKTLIINAIRYGMGDIFNKEIFGKNLPYPHVQLFFNLSKLANKDKLFEILEDEETDVLCERWMSESGKSRVKINGKFFSIPEYQNFCRSIINIHGQNSLDDLLSRKNQILLFDSYFKDEITPLLDNFSQKRKHYFETIQELKMINDSNTKREREIDFISYQIHEIDIASIKPGEMDQLKFERDLLSNSQKILSNLKNATDLLEEDNRNIGSSIIGTLNSVTNLLSHLKDYGKELDDIYKISTDCESVIKEMARDIANESSKIENLYDEKRLSDVITRIDQISHLQKKYGPSEEDILATKIKLETDLQFLKSTEETIEKKQVELKELENYLTEKAEKISHTRRTLQPIFEHKINKELKDLSMENATFKVDFSMETDDSLYGLPRIPDHVKLFDNGIDRLEFKITTNPGQPELPISQIASGGELSRIMLAIKTIIGVNDTLQTLIFDEIDSGIGGNTGNSIGNKLKSLGLTQQIICITHLPQIASKAIHHFYIEKKSLSDSTEISIKELHQEERVEEISRMLDGNLLSATSLKHAREMINS